MKCKRRLTSAYSRLHIVLLTMPKFGLEVDPNIAAGTNHILPSFLRCHRRSKIASAVHGAHFHLLRTALLNQTNTVQTPLHPTWFTPSPSSLSNLFAGSLLLGLSRYAVNPQKRLISTAGPTSLSFASRTFLIENFC